MGAARPASGLPTALVAAVVLHLGAFVWALHSRPPTPPQADRIVVELREVPATTKEIPTPARIAAVPRPRPARPQVPEVAPPEITPPDITPPEPSQPPTADAEPGTDTPEAIAGNDTGSPDETDEGAETQAGSGPEAVATLHPEALDAAMAHWRSVRGPGEDGDDDAPGTLAYGTPDTPEAEHARVSRRVARTLGDVDARGRASAGVVDPYFASVGRRTDRALKPKQTDLGYADGVLGYAQAMLGTWAAAGKQWTATGNPLRDPESLLAAPVRGAVVDGSALYGKLPDPATYAWLWNSGQMATQLFVVEIELVQQRDGRPIVARILKPSGQRAFDLAARDALLAAANDGTAPEHGLGLGGTRITTHWRVEAQPVPQTPSAVTDPASGGAVIGLAASGVFDETLGEGPTMPGQVRILHRVTLLAVYGGERLPAPSEAP